MARRQKDCLDLLRCRSPGRDAQLGSMVPHGCAPRALQVNLTLSKAGRTGVDWAGGCMVTHACAQGAPGQPYTHEGAVDKTGEGTLLRILTMRAHMRAGGPRWTSRAAAAGADAADGGPKLIPRIIHQTYRSGAIPGHLRPAMHSWRRANEDWEIRFYDDEACGAFVAREFPEYLDAYRGLAKDVERSDFFRSVRGSREP